MSFEHFKKMRDEQEARLALPWYKRIPLNIFDFVLYRIMYRIPDWRRQAWYKCQELVYGYSDSDIWNLNDYIVRKVYFPLKEFVYNYEQQGMSLPSAFETDPAAWLLTLKKIEYAFDRVWEDERGLSDWSKKSIEEIREDNRKIQEGMELFGKYMMDLWD